VGNGGAVYPEIKHPRREAALWPPPNVEVKTEWSNTSILRIFVYGMQRDKFTFHYTAYSDCQKIKPHLKYKIKIWSDITSY
jgi:hypothetical protein